MIFPLLLALALTNSPAKGNQPWVPADTDMADQDCGIDGHRHSLNLDEHGHYVVNKEKGEPDIVFDGQCHDNSTERLLKDSDRKVLPVPSPNPKPEVTL